MKITFCGAAQDVTGSMHLIEVNGQRLLLDCGSYQGRRAEAYERNLHFPFLPSSVDAMILSHAHIDHCGNIPNLTKQGYDGNIWCTPATRSLCTHMLMDSGHIQEQDVEYLNKQRARQGEEPVEPLYTQADVERCLGQFVGVHLKRKFNPIDGVAATFFEAGHIIGAASVQLDIHERATNKRWRLVFSGDIGRTDSPILNPPQPPTDADIVIMESTYGNRLHDTYENAAHKLEEVIDTTVRRHGKVIIPAFAVGRTQELVFALNQLDENGDIPVLPIFIDSPLAINATTVFRNHPETWNEALKQFMRQQGKRSPFDDRNIEYVQDVRRSKQINFLNQSAIIIAASGMAESGRILHHLKNNIEDRNNTILIVSYQAQETLGRRIRDGRSPVRIFGQEYQVRAQVETIEGYSAHADQSELLQWVNGLDRKQVQHIFLVHGEAEGANALTGRLQDYGFAQVSYPVRGQSFEF